MVFHGAFADRIEGILDRVPGVKGWLWVDDGSGPCPEWATPYEDAAKSAIGRVSAPWGRSGDDLFMLYTGGTTGMPKGVMWRQDDLFARLIDERCAPLPRRWRHRSRARAALEASPGGVTILPACPLMHGTGNFPSNTVLAEGGRVCLLESRKYDPVEMLDTIQREKVNALVFVGDPFARPLLAALDDGSGHVGPELAHDDHFVGGHVERAGEGGAAGPPSRHAPRRRVQLVGGAGHGRVGVGPRRRGQDGVVHAWAPTSRCSPRTDGRWSRAPTKWACWPWAGATRSATTRTTEKSERTFKEIDGVRYSIPGDFAQVGADGTIHLLGRGSVCINSGGEKIFPEEVEEALKTHEAVRDAVVVGVPHPTYGEQVVAVVELHPDAGVAPAEAELIEHVKARLASYKAPRRVRAVPTIGRAPNGKVDYRRHRAESMDELGVPAGLSSGSGPD